jgi:hypothetical protein
VKTLLQGYGTVSCYEPAISKELFDMPLQQLVRFVGAKSFKQVAEQLLHEAMLSSSTIKLSIFQLQSTPAETVLTACILFTWFEIHRATSRSP